MEATAGGLLESFRNILVKVAEFASNYLPFPSENIYYFILIALSLFVAARLTGFIPRVKRTWILWLIIAGTLFYVLGFI